MFLLKLCRRLSKAREGAMAVEYALMVGIIGAVLVVSLGPVGTTLNDMFLGIKEMLDAHIE